MDTTFLLLVLHFTVPEPLLTVSVRVAPGLSVKLSSLSFALPAANTLRCWQESKRPCHHNKNQNSYEHSFQFHVLPPLPYSYFRRICFFRNVFLSACTATDVTAFWLAAFAAAPAVNTVMDSTNQTAAPKHSFSHAVFSSYLAFHIPRFLPVPAIHSLRPLRVLLQPNVQGIAGQNFLLPKTAYLLPPFPFPYFSGTVYHFSLFMSNTYVEFNLMPFGYRLKYEKWYRIVKVAFLPGLRCLVLDLPYFQSRKG